MRELTMDELEEVSGAGIADAAIAWGTAFGIGEVALGSTWGTISALTALGMSPIAATAMIGLALYGGYQLMQD